MKTYKIYKGLKQPLVFFGLKDKYIYYAIGIVAATLFSGLIISSLAGALYALLPLVGGAAGIYYLFYLQDHKGLYRKTKNNNEIIIITSQFKNGEV